MVVISPTGHEAKLLGRPIGEESINDTATQRTIPLQLLQILNASSLHCLALQSSRLLRYLKRFATLRVSYNMLCESCQLHFDFKKIDYTPTFIDRFELSKRLRSQGDPEFDDVRVAKYESDTVEYCSRYKSAQSDDSIDPCPWLKLDSDTINPDGSHHSSFPTHGPEIWGTVIPARSQAQITAAVDCDICLRLSYFASSKSSNYVESQLWVHIHTMRPDSILFQTRDNDETVKSMKLNLCKLTHFSITLSISETRLRLTSFVRFDS